MKTKVRSVITFFISIAVIAFLGFAGFKGFEVAGWEFKTFNDVITKGLDLKGGISVLMEIQQDEVPYDVLQTTKQLLDLRVNKVGVSETVVTTEGDKRIRIDIPGQYDSNKIVETLTKTGELTFVGPEKDVILTGKDIKKSEVYVDDKGQPIITLELNEDGKAKFAEATEKYLGKEISIKMDDEVLTSPTVTTVITNGEATITGNRSLEEAERISGIINSGALPIPVKAVSVKTVGAQLGESALPNALKAGGIGILLVFLFMIIFYRVPGLMASLALSVYVLIVLYLFVSLNVALTLPGIAGFLLTIGMAVDANILIFARIKEELAIGKSIKFSIKAGFNNALSSILDSNITTAIAGVVLYFFGSGPVKGFALTLIVGIMASMFTALVVTKFFINLAVNMGMLNKPSMFGRIKGGKN